MKKFFITTLCLVLVYLISLKAIPALYPGIDTLADYKSIEVTPVEDYQFEERIDNLQYILKEYNADGEPYIIDSVQELDGESESSSESDSQEESEETTEEENNTMTEETVNEDSTEVEESSTVNESEGNYSEAPIEREITIDDVTLTGVYEDTITFIIDGNEYQQGLGLIQDTGIEILEINPEEQSTILGQSSDIRLLVVDE